MNKPKKTLKMHRNPLSRSKNQCAQSSPHPIMRFHHRKVTNQLCIPTHNLFLMILIQILKP